MSQTLEFMHFTHVDVRMINVKLGTFFSIFVLIYILEMQFLYRSLTVAQVFLPASLSSVFLVIWPSNLAKTWRMLSPQVPK